MSFADPSCVRDPPAFVVATGDLTLGKAVDKRDDQIEHAAEKVEPYLHEARERVHKAATKDR